MLVSALKLLHPYMPFVTEEIYTSIQPYTLAANIINSEELEKVFDTFKSHEESIMISAWPVYDEKMHFEECEAEVDLIREAVSRIRNARAEMNVPLSKKADVYVVSASEEIRGIFEKGKNFFASLAKAEKVILRQDAEGMGDDALSVPLSDVTIYIPLNELVDIEKEKERLEGEKKKLEGELKRSENMLTNEKFLSKAPAAKIEEEKEKQEKYKKMMAQVEAQLAKLK